MDIIADKYGMSQNSSTSVNEAIAQMKDGDTLVFSNKEYHFYKDYSQMRKIHFTNTDSFKNPEKYFGLLFENLNDITVDGNGATFVIHGDICSFGMINCNNVKLKDFTIRYASPSCVELTVAKQEGKRVTFSIPEGQLWYLDKNDFIFFEQSPFTKKNYWQFKNDENSWECVIHKADRKTVQRIPKVSGVFSGISSVQRKGMTEVEVTYSRKRSFELDDTYVFSTNKNRNTCGLFFGECSNIDSSNITVNYMAGFGWLSQMCENVSFSDITFKGDKWHRTSSFADLIHVCGCKGSVNVKHCYFDGPHDDGINIHGSFARFVKKIDDYTAKFEFVHNQQGGHRLFFEGDSVNLYYRSSLAKVGETLIVNSVEDSFDDKTMTVTFAQKLPSEAESRKFGQSNIVAENISYCPDVEVCDCTFTAIPTRDILCTSSGKVRIHDNVFSDSQMAHIFISNDAFQWYESGPVKDVEIYNNKFYLGASKYKKCPAILVKPITLGKSRAMVHENIKIHDNYFKIERDVPIRAQRVKNIAISNNTFDGKSKIILKNCTKA